LFVCVCLRVDSAVTIWTVESARKKITELEYNHNIVIVGVLIVQLAWLSPTDLFLFRFNSERASLQVVGRIFFNGGETHHKNNIGHEHIVHAKGTIYTDIFYQNYLVFGLCPSSGILKTRERVSETGSVSVLR
jgi:hypothetical protein